jgi:hypothetical protein
MRKQRGCFTDEQEEELRRGGPDGLLSGGRINGAALMPTSGAN